MIRSCATHPCHPEPFGCVQGQLRELAHPPCHPERGRGISPHSVRKRKIPPTGCLGVVSGEPFGMTKLLAHLRTAEGLEHEPENAAVMHWPVRGSGWSRSG